MILLYPSTEKQFENNGFGSLSDAISCTVTEERNGAYELQMEYPITGLHYADITSRCIITSKPTPYKAPQPFRIYRISKPLSGRITVYAQHISYDLSGIPVSPFTAGNILEAFSGFKAYSAIENPFTFVTDKTTQATFSFETPSSNRSLLGGSQGSILDIYGGEYEFDKWTVNLWNQRGQDNGVTIRYGKNLTDLQQDENISNVATGVYPYWYSSGEDAVLVDLPEKIVNAPGTYDFTRIVPLDLSTEFQEQPTEEQLRTRAEKYVEDNNIGIPKVSLTVSFQPLEQTEEYKDLALLEQINLCDTVTIEYPQLKVSAKAKCIKTSYDALNNRYISIELGDSRFNIADTIANQQQEIEQLPQSPVFQQAVENATNWITNGQKGEIIAIKRNGKWVEIASLDTGDINTAQSVWRWNNGGFGHSSNGYNGPFTLAMTADGHINASVITVGTLNANIIKAGRLESLNGKAYIDLTTGESAVSRLIGINSDVYAEIGKTSDERGGEGIFIHKSDYLVGQLSIAPDSTTSEAYPYALWLLSRGELVLQSNSSGMDDAPNRIWIQKDADGYGKFTFSLGNPNQVMNDFLVASAKSVYLQRNGSATDSYLYFSDETTYLRAEYGSVAVYVYLNQDKLTIVRQTSQNSYSMITLENNRIGFAVNGRALGEFNDSELNLHCDIEMNGWSIKNCANMATK